MDKSKLKVGYGLAVVLVGLFGVYATTKLVDRKSYTPVKAAVLVNNISTPPRYETKPVVSWGNSSFHDSMGVRDPHVVKENNMYYMFYDCIEDFLNPSFESNWLTNGWEGKNANISSSTDRSLYGSRSLKLAPGTTGRGYAFTSNYYYNFTTQGAVLSNLAVPTGVEVVPNTIYIISAYVKGRNNELATLDIRQFKDDPMFATNEIPNTLSSKSTKITDAYNRDYVRWYRISNTITTTSTTRAITISLGSLKNSYWDGIQIEKVNSLTASPSPFPSDSTYNAKNFNKKFEDTVGWQSCYATSTDGLNFSKKGQVEITGQRMAWEAMEKPGWVGSSSQNLIPFKYNGKWYGYVYIAGHSLSNPNDKGLPNIRRPGYYDMRLFVLGGAKTSLVMADNLTGPYQRTQPSLPVMYPAPAWPNPPCTLQTADQTCFSLVVNDIPHFVNGSWQVLVNGNPSWPSGWKNITTGIAKSDNPITNWNISTSSGKIFDNIINAPNPQDNLSPECPTYYYDTLSRHHIIFVNNIQRSVVEAFWARDLDNKVPLNNRSLIVGESAFNWGGNGSGWEQVSAHSEVESLDGSQLWIYYAGRRNYDTSGFSDQNAYKYMFYDIGGASINLPLLTLPGKSSELISTTKIAPNHYQFKLRFFNNTGASRIGNTQLIVDSAPGWVDQPYLFRGMYAVNQVDHYGLIFQEGAYLWRPELTTSHYGWGDPNPMGTTMSNTFVDAKVIDEQTLWGDTVDVTWEVVFKSGAFPVGTYNIYLWMSEIDNPLQNQNKETQPIETFTFNSNINYYTRVGQLTIEP